MVKRNSIISIILSVFLAFLVLISSVMPIVASADDSSSFSESSSAPQIEYSDVLDDLNGAIINGEEFSLKEYNFNESKNVQVIYFFEYNYSFFESRQSEFGLYLYIYNPKGLSFVSESPLHSISFKVGEDESRPYEKYPLSVLSFSQETEYYGLFYKLKVLLAPEEQKAILKQLNSTERVYSVSEVELLEEGQLNSTPIQAQAIYKFSGYMPGCGNSSTEESSLKCINEQMETLSLKPYATTYRPLGTNGKNDYTQDSLHSVYFAVPNRFIESYGEMTAIHATWLNAVLRPALVTGNQEVYAIINEQLGVFRPDLDYCYVGNYGEHIEDEYYLCGDGVFAYPFDNVGNNLLTECERELEVLYMLFNSGIGENSADNYIVSSKDIRSVLEESATKYGGELVNGKYAACMFDSVDSEFTEVNIRSTDEYDITSEVVGSSWWDKFWGNTTTSVFEGVKAIDSVSDEDFSGDIIADCDKLYIGVQDYTDFKQYYDDNKANSTVYLFRYQLSDYIAPEATLLGLDTILGLSTWEKVDTNAYFFQETVNLDFDIIDVTFSMGEKETVIPVIMKPLDVIPDATPPVNTESDEMTLLEKIMALIGIVLLVVLYNTFLAPFVNPIISMIIKGALKGIWLVIKFVFKILTLPLRLLFGRGNRG